MMRSSFEPFLTKPLLLFCPALLLTAAVPASPQPDSGGVFQETVDVRVLNVEVVVTDRDGRRVTGLGAGDFRLLVDGETVPIEFFTEVRQGRAVEPAPPAGSPTTATPPRAAAEAGRVPASTLVFIDDYFAIGAHRDLVLERLAAELPLVAPGDRMAVVAFDGRQPLQLCGWTDDAGRLEACLAAARDRPTFGLHRTTERRRRGLASVPGGGTFSAVEEELELERVVEAAVATLRGVPRPPGRKLMLLLAGAWPSYARFRLVDKPTQTATDLELLEEIAETANLLGYTVYPLDLPGRREDGNVDRQQAPDPVSRVLAQETVRQSALRWVAEHTGGRALLYGDRMRPLAVVAEDVASYYWLGFTPRRERDDRSHRIRIELRPAGLEARARAGFLDLAPGTEQALVVESALKFRDPLAENDFAVNLGSARRAEGRKVELALAIDLPLDRLVYLPYPEGWRAQVEVRLAALDGRGARSEVLVVPLVLEAEARPPAGAVHRYRARALLRKARHDLVVTLRDPASGEVLTSRVEWRP